MRLKTGVTIIAIVHASTICILLMIPAKRALSGPIPSPPPKRTLTYIDGGRGQGLGNIMNGLIAASLLSIESKRCLIVQWPSFAHTFSSERRCFHDLNGTGARVDYWNFGYSDSAAHFRSVIESSVDDVRMSGNEYPNFTWPLVPNGTFHELFEPRFTDAIETVDILFHVRVGDSSRDRRAGDKQWIKLQDLFPNATLIINSERLYKDTTWRRPTHHKQEVSFHKLASTIDSSTWFDWYMILKAKRVIHSPSSFSESAVRWSGAAHSRLADESILEHDTF